MRHRRRLIALAAPATAVLLAVGATSPVAASRSTSGSGKWIPRELGYGAPADLNERAQIVGEDTPNPILWQNGKARTLSTSRIDATSLYAAAINDDGEIVGGTWEGEPVDRALLWQRNGVLRILPAVRKGSSTADDINNSGQIVGFSGGRGFYSEEGRPVVWENGRPHALPGTGAGVAHAINDRGVIVGRVGAQAVLWENGKQRKLGTLGGRKSEAVDINQLGQVVGWILAKGGNARRGFLWQNGKMVDLGAGFEPAAINDRGQVVGSCRNDACVWEKGKVTRLDDLGYSDAVATAINERQQIVGSGIEGGGDMQPLPVALLWTFKP